jgi:diguanylate cyclase (GGDEF)-like protein/PAS domain S-box-containing protein
MTAFGKSIDLDARLSEVAGPATLESRLFGEFFKVSPDGIVLLDTSDRVIKANSAFLEMFGYGSEEVIGNKINDLIVDSDHRDEARVISIEALEHRISRRETVRCRKDGQRVDVEIYGMPVHVGGRLIGIYGIYRDITERLATLHALKESRNAFQTMAENTGQLVYDYDVLNGRIRWLGAVESVLGLEPDQVGQFSLDDWASHIHPDEREACLKALEECDRTGSRYHVQYRFLRQDGEWIPVEDIGSYLLDDQGRPYRSIGTIADISRRKQQQLALFNARELAEITLNAIADGVIRIDTAGTIEYINAAARRLLGSDQADATGQPVESIIQLDTNAADQSSCEQIQRCLQGEKIQIEDGKAFLLTHDGARRIIDFSAAPVRDSDQTIVGAVIAFSDISEQIEIRQQLAYQAEHDALTGLGNRYRFESEANRLIADSMSGDREHTLLYMDLDQFKIVNDTCGHHAGDELLRRLSRLIGEQVRRHDVLARLGGDEFGLLLSDCSPDKATDIAAGIIRTVNDFDFVWDHQRFTVGISIGVVSLRGQADSTSLLKAADQACYAAKDQGRNRYHVYRSDDHELRRRSKELRAAADVDAALADNRFELYFQRIDNIQGTSETSHCELLLRMRNLAGELVSPSEFIPGAERYGKMAALDAWVVEKAFTIIAGLQADNRLPGHYRYSINLSGATINDPAFHDHIGNLLERIGIDPSLICFEITENSAVTHFRNAARFLQRMRAIGCKIMLDDFGSGLSSFTYLKMLPVDYLKIDGNLIDDIISNPFDLAIIRAIQTVARAFNIPVIAERVECQAVLDKLTEIGVDYAQGFYIHRPEPFPALNGQHQGP